MSQSFTTVSILDCSLVIDNELINFSNKAIEYLKKDDKEFSDKYIINFGKISILSIEGFYECEERHKKRNNYRQSLPSEDPLIAYKDCLLKKLGSKIIID